MYPPFFIFGAFLSGFATVLLLITPMRRLLRLERYITGRHLDVLGRLLLIGSLFVGYAYITDTFNTYYGGEKAEIAMFQEKLFGYYAGIYWATILFNVLLPQLLWFPTIRLNQLVVGLISIGVIIGMWCERFTIVVVSLHRPRLPSSYGLYSASVWDWLTMIGTVGFFVFGILLIVRLIPVISMFEMCEILAPRRP
jgi:Ni/Fe-hydrogenase subunit HybB-like protein